MNWYIDVLKKYAVFEGRARRMEYWMFVLFNVIISFVIAIVEGVLGSPGFLVTIYSLAVLIPSIAVAVRRLHDTDRTGWWLLLFLIPVIGPIVLILFFVFEGDAGDNQYGPNPKADAQTA